MNRFVNFHEDTGSNKQIDIVHDATLFSLLHQGNLLASDPKQLGPDNTLSFCQDVCHFGHHSGITSDPNTKHAAAERSMEVSKLYFGEFPKDAFEPVPIKPDRELGASIATSLLENVLHRTVDNAVNNSFRLSSNLFEDIPATDFLKPLPVRKDEATSTLYLHQDPTLGGGHAHEPSSPCTISRKRSYSIPAIEQIPKRRRTTSSDGEPSFRRHQEKQWIEQFNELFKFKELHGHCLVPHTYPKNQVLSRWVKRQRYQYKLKQSGKVSTMTDARIHKLENVGFVWDSHAITWNKRFQELQQYREEHGNCNVPSNYPRNQELAVWVKCQRRQYKLFWSSNKSSSMTLDRMRVLNGLGFQWKVREDDSPQMFSRNDFQWDQTSC